MTTTIYVGDCKDVLPTLPANSVQCVITSPPYWGLRDYGVDGQVWGGDADCEHKWDEDSNGNIIGSPAAYCMCGAWCGSLGLEPTPELYVEHLVEIFREVKRVLRNDGVVFLNLGDSYASASSCVRRNVIGEGSPTSDVDRPNRLVSGLKEKDLCGIPWRVAFALQADGWYLRQDIIWAKAVSGMIRKGSAMPESVQDRFCKSHEYVFLLTKSKRYFFDSVAVADILDTHESHEYNGIYEDKTLHQMQREKAVGDVQQEQPARQRPNRCMQNMHSDYAQTLGPEIQSIEKGESNSNEVLLLRERASDKDDLSGEIRADTRTARAVQADGAEAREGRQIQRAAEEIRPEPEGEKEQGEKRSRVYADRQRTVLEAQDSDQAQESDCDNGLHSDARRMDSNQETVQLPLCILPQTVQSVGNGPCDSSEQGGDACSGEHSSSLQNLQCEERQQATATRRSVWLISPQPFKGAHFAVMPTALVEPMIKAGTSERGCCAACGAGWERVVERTAATPGQQPGYNRDCGARNDGDRAGSWTDAKSATIGWQPTCECSVDDTVPCVCLDPFAGAGTVGLVADRLQRDTILIELSPTYAEMARRRIEGEAPMFTSVDVRKKWRRDANNPDIYSNT